MVVLHVRDVVVGRQVERGGVVFPITDAIERMVEGPQQPLLTKSPFRKTSADVERGGFGSVGDGDDLVDLAKVTPAKAFPLRGEGVFAVCCLRDFPDLRGAGRVGLCNVEATGVCSGPVVILNGTFPHSLLLEIFTDAGCGTMFTQDES